MPDARVMLFGSRLTDNVHEESDWDILVLTKDKYPRSVKWKIHDRLFNLSVQYSTFINIMLVQEDEWNTGAGYYSLKQRIGNNFVAF